MIEYISVKEDKVNEAWILKNLGGFSLENAKVVCKSPIPHLDSRYGMVFSLTEIIDFIPQAEELAALWAAKEYRDNLEFLALNGLGLDIAGYESDQLCIHMPDGTLRTFDPWVNAADLCYAMVTSGVCPSIVGSDLVIDGEVRGTYTDEQIMDTHYMLGEIRESFRGYVYEKALKDNEYMRVASGFLFSDQV